MARKTRSKAFYQRRSNNSTENLRQRRHTNRSRRRGRKKRFLFLKIFCILLIFLAIYQYRVSKVEVSINKAVEAIKEADLKKQETYFDKLADINQTLAASYSDDSSQKEEFLKTLYENLDLKIKSEEKTEKGTLVQVEVSNIDFIKVFDTIKKDDPNFHRDYINALEKESKDKIKKDAQLLLKRRFTGYKIYEDRDFIDGILGGSLKYAKDKVSL
ncbi:MAG: hypothetical protein PUG67_00505 [Peptoniphilaceae bacterium]|nr:hypothetical protein [Peptoniphilaceae bacterium]MDY6018768.1 hypothetical protein [Anaerococcus sp.]